MKIATLIALLHPFLILVGTAISSSVYKGDNSVGWLNKGYHGFSEMLYTNTHQVRQTMVVALRGWATIICFGTSPQGLY